MTISLLFKNGSSISDIKINKKQLDDLTRQLQWYIGQNKDAFFFMGDVGFCASELAAITVEGS